MCIVPEHLSPRDCRAITSHGGLKPQARDTSGDPPNLLELAANNDLEGFRTAVEQLGAPVDACGSWYCRQYGSNKMSWLQRTPTMIAATYGSLDVLEHILAHKTVRINGASSSDGSTALHCAMVGASKNTIETVKLLLKHGADPTIPNAQGKQPLQYMNELMKLQTKKVAEEEVTNNYGEPLEKSSSSAGSYAPSGSTQVANLDYPQCLHIADGSNVNVSHTSDTCNASPAAAAGTINGIAAGRDDASDSFLPDLKNQYSIYDSDEFRMFSFKVRPCSKAYSHDWTECPFVHPGENARRRDPRRHHYSCVPCPDFRKGACKHGDACDYAHGIFESWLHPAQYRTRLCKDGTSCKRKVCFFAHAKEELRPLQVSSENALSSYTEAILPNSCLSHAASATVPLLPPSNPPQQGHLSPVASSSVPSFSPLNSSQLGQRTSSPPISPSSANSARLGSWSSIPLLQLPGVSTQASRLRATVSARDLLMKENSRRLVDIQGRMESKMAATLCAQSQTLSNYAREKYHSLGLNAASSNLEEVMASYVASSPRSPLQLCLQSSGNGSPYARPGKSKQFGFDVTPVNLEDIFTASGVSPQNYSYHQISSRTQADDFQMMPKPAHVSDYQSQLHIQAREVGFSPSVQKVSQSSMAEFGGLHGQGLFNASTLQNMQCASGQMDQALLSITAKQCDVMKGSRSASAAAYPVILPSDEPKQSSKDLGGLSSCSDWGSPTGKPQWGFNNDEFSRVRQSNNFIYDFCLAKN